MKIKYKHADTYYYVAENPAEGTNEAGYLKVIKNYIQYYYKYAERYKWWYLSLSIIKFLILAMIPVSQTIEPLVGLPYVTAAASSLCILLESVMELFQMKEKWLLYRKAGNDLLREEREFATSTNGYSAKGEKEKFEKFVENVESIISDEASKWNRLFQTSKAETKG